MKPSYHIKSDHFICDLYIVLCVANRVKLVNREAGDEISYAVALQLVKAKAVRKGIFHFQDQLSACEGYISPPLSM